MAYTEEKRNELLPLKTGGNFPWKLPDIQLTRGDVLSSNLLIKKSKINVELDSDYLIELIKCENDPGYFIETYCRIIHPDEGIVPFILRDYQKELIELYKNNRYVIAMQSR